MHENRYSRQILLKEIGAEGQRAISESRILIIGAGGVGCPAALALAEAGVRHITLVDNDSVEEANLPRQLLHLPHRVGMKKVDSAKLALQSINPAVSVTAHCGFADEKLTEELLASHDLIIDASDNFKTRHATNRAALQARKPLISASSIRFSVQLAVFDFRNDTSACYSCLFPEDDQQDIKASSVGVFSPATAISGFLAATEALKILTGISKGLPKLLIFDLLTDEMQTLKITTDPACRVCYKHS